MKPEEVSVFPVGGKNEAFANYFTGQSYLNMLTTEGVVIGNVTFEPGCRNNWHIHHAEKGGGQILFALPDADIIRNGAKRRRNSIPEA